MDILRPSSRAPPMLPRSDHHREIEGRLREFTWSRSSAPASSLAAPMAVVTDAATVMVSLALLPIREHGILFPTRESSAREVTVRIVSRRTLQRFWEAGHADAEQPLRSWFAEVAAAAWSTMADIKERYAHASVIDGERVVFNIGGNKYRLVVKVWFAGQAVFIKFVGTHAAYDKIDVREL